MNVAIYGRLSTVELRLLDLILAGDAFAKTPASVQRGAAAVRRADAPRFDELRMRREMVEATRTRVGAFDQYGSLAELLRIREQAPPPGRTARTRRER